MSRDWNTKMARTDRPGEAYGGGSGRGPASYSYRGSELTAGERRDLVKQNKAADSLKATDLDKVDANKAKYQAAKEAAAQRLKDANTSGKKVAAAAAVPVIIAAEEVGRAIGKKQGTQKDHAITNHDNHTRTVTLGTNPN